MLAAALVTLKQHRFEVAFAGFASIAVAVWALVTEFQLTALGVPARCINDWLVTGPAGREDCVAPMRQWGSVLYAGEGIFNGQGSLPLAAMPGSSAASPSSHASWRHEQHKRLGHFTRPERRG
jgi:hypothetical protein